MGELIGTPEKTNRLEEGMRAAPVAAASRRDVGWTRGQLIGGNLIGAETGRRLGKRLRPRDPGGFAGTLLDEGSGNSDRWDYKEMMRRRGKELRERVVGVALLALTSPAFALCALAIKLEGLIHRGARGPVFFTEERISRGRVIGLLKFRVLTSSALSNLGPGPTHIATLEQQGQLTRVGRVLKQWYLDELPQLINIVRGDMFLIGTRPYPLELYEEEMARGITRKRDMPAGLIGPVQASKGRTDVDQLELDLRYWELFQNGPWWRVLVEDLKIVLRSFRVQAEHRGI